jgi:phosphoglycerate dehydrogenase-like enzyme
MDDTTVLVLADPAEPQLAMLKELPESTGIAVGKCLEAFERAAPEAAVILNWSGSRELLEQVWRMAPRVRWVHSRSAGLEDVLFPGLVESGAVLTNSRGVFSAPLGEFVLGAALFFAKDLRRMVRSQEDRCWDPFDVTQIRGQTMGIVGYGDIGRAVACLAKAFGMRVLALRRRPELCRGDALVDEVIPVARKLELMARSDYVVVTAPLTPETRGLIGEPELRAMRASAVLINVGRGPVVEEAPLVRALQERWIHGAALDVFDSEPLPHAHPFYRLDNVLLSPHCADHTPDWMDRAMQFFLDNFERFRKGESLLNVVEKRQGY